jgi:cellulose synthase operon protein C
MAPHDADAIYYNSTVLLERRGPLPTLKFLRNAKVQGEASSDIQASLVLEKMDCLVQLRDFEAADKAFEQAQSIAPEMPWLWVERASSLERQDETEAAIVAAQQALNIRPHYRPAAQVLARLLQAVGRTEEALDILQSAAAHNQSGSLYIQQGLVFAQLEQQQSAWQSFQNATTYLPCMDTDLFHWLCGQCSDATYHTGHIELAIMFARMSKVPLAIKLADRLAMKLPPCRVQLPVPYIRQTHKTCGPATLASIAAYHCVPAEHVSIAESICYDGTPAASERTWAETNGFATREFTMTWQAATELLDRKLPFTLTTHEATSAHLQAVVGYDLRRKSLLVRDPSTPHLVEYDSESLLEQQAWVGPRAMLLVPTSQLSHLDDRHLPDAPIFDEAYKLQLALERHDRATAQRHWEILRLQYPHHDITAQALRAISNYDGNQQGLLKSYEDQLARHPDITRLLMGKISCLKGLARRDEVLTLLELKTKSEPADPLFGQQLALELLNDARHAERCQHLLARAIAARSGDGQAYAGLGHAFAARQRWNESMECFRFAACLDENNDIAASAYFSNARCIGMEEEALSFLKDRFIRRGKRYASPSRTLFVALEALGRSQQALEVIDQSLAWRPHDADVELFAAEIYARVGQSEKAQKLLKLAQPRCRFADWQRASATLDLLAGDLPAALARYQTVLAAEPLAMDALGEVVRLMTATDSRAAAIDQLSQTARLHPHHEGLARLVVDTIEDEGERGIEVIKKLLDIAPDDPWVHRELAIRLGRRDRFEEAFAALKGAYEREPDTAPHFVVCGYLELWNHNPMAARAAFMHAVTLDADSTQAIRGLMLLGTTPTERAPLLEHIRKELRRQVSFGPGLACYREVLSSEVSSDDTLAFLREAHAARPDLQVSWTTLVDHLLEMNNVDEAASVAEQYLKQFPLQAGPFLKEAEVHRTSGDRIAMVKALRSAVALAPGNAAATRHLGEALLYDQSIDEAVSCLAKAASLQPLDGSYQMSLANALWAADRRSEALAKVKLALHIDPSLVQAWETLGTWSAATGTRQLAIEFAQELVRLRPLSPWAQFGLAETLEPSDRFEEQLAALNAAIALFPRFTDAHDNKALELAMAGRYDEALKACAPVAYGDQIPLNLKGRAAWIEGLRGNRERAIAMMRELLEAQPDYLFGLAFLGRWLAEEGNRKGAKEAYGKAVTLMPSNTDVGWALLQLELDDDDHEAAASTLAILRRYDNSPTILMASAQVDLANELPDKAIETFLALGRMHGEHLGYLDETARKIVTAGHSSLLASVLETMIRDPSVVPEIGYIWAKHGVERSFWTWCWRLSKMLPAAPATQALVAFIENLSRGGFGIPLALAIRWFGPSLRTNDALWGTVGYALLRQGRPVAALSWLSDWKTRTGLRPWMLLNVVTALRTLGRDYDAHQLSTQALSLPSDHTMDEHRMWLAWDAVMAGRTDEAARFVAVPQETEGALAQFVTTLIHAALLIHKGTAPATDKDKVSALVRAAKSQWPGAWRRRLSRRLLRQLTHLAKSFKETP